MLLKQCILTLDRNELFTMRKQSQKARKILAAIQCIALVGMMRDQERVSRSGRSRARRNYYVCL